MNARDLERYLHEHIPLSRAMGVSVARLEPETVELVAPLAPNINHRHTVFGGSASAVATLAAWSLVHTRLLAAGHASRLVIQSNSMTYDRPLSGEFSAQAFLPHPERWDPFLQLLARKGRARITAGANLVFGERTAGRFEGEFVALKAP